MSRKRWRWGVPHVDHQIDRHGHARWSYRRDKGPRTTLPPYGSADFLTAWQAAHQAADAGEKLTVMAGAGRIKTGTLAAALAAYYTSNEWTKELGDGSRGFRRPILEKLKARYGDAPMVELQRKHIQHWIADKKPNAQKNWMKAISGLIKFAMKSDLLASNPLLGVVKDKAERTDGHIAWTEDDVEKFRTHYAPGTRERLALELMLNLAVRRSDACRIGPPDIKGGWLTDFQPKKTARTTGDRISIPIRPELAAAIAAMKTVSTRTYLVTDQGKPFASEASFGMWMRKAYDKAGLPDAVSHGLRKLAMIRLAFAGCSATEIMKISGHRSLSEVQRYVEQANQMKMAAQAMNKLETYQNANK